MDLKSKYLGLDLSSPVVVAPSPLAKEVANIKKMEEHGAGAVVLGSLFEEQLRAEAQEMEERLDGTNANFAEASSFFPQIHEYRFGPTEYLKHIGAAKNAVNIPVIASLNGSTSGGWTDYAKQIEEAGADALELNIYAVPSDLTLSGTDLEERHVAIVQSVRDAVKLPMAVKLSPFYSNVGNVAKRIADTGVEGLVLFNRFMQPDIDLDSKSVKASSYWSTSEDQRLPYRWIAILKGRVDANLAATGGIHEAEDVIKGLMVGADVTMLCSSLLKNGVEHLRKINLRVTKWAEDNGYASLDELRGSLSQQKVSNPTAFERAQFVKAIGTDLAA